MSSAQQVTCASLQCSGQLYAINMQYGMGGARTNAAANLLVFSSNSSGPPRATDFEVQLGDPAQTGNVSVLSMYSSSSDYLIRVGSLHNNWLQFCFPVAIIHWLVGQLLVAADLHTFACTLCYSLKSFRRSHQLLMCSDGGGCRQWTLLACFMLPSSVSTCYCGFKVVFRVVFQFHWYINGML